MPRFVVIMPAYNAEGTVALAIKSSLRAMPRDSRIVVLDDASSDSTARIIESVEDSRVKLVRADVNSGVTSSLNRLLSEVDSEFVARMDADDVCLPWRFRYQMHASRRGADFVFSTVVRFQNFGRRLRPNLPISISPDAMVYHLLLANPVSHPTMFGRLQPILEVGGYRSVLAEDYDLWLRLCSAGYRIRRLGLPTVAYRVHPKQVSSGAAWHARSAADPLLRESYSRLAETAIGLRPTWYGELRARVHGAPRGASASLAEFSAALAARSSADIFSRERVFLLKKRDKLIGSPHSLS